ncbi:apoptosis facilitator Bcl-2-like protein 14 [Candoia aspera]|uniref:apoptosis facilitator Bcl-2-like protein 14 n=1 Tax=Candoia aspera TaxID=51853 RepID=UPI002FD83417
MEEIPLEDTDRTSMEYRLLRAYSQRRLSASKYGQLLEREAKAEEESRAIMPAGSLAKDEVTLPEISPIDHKPPAQNKDQKKVKKKKKKKKAAKEMKAKSSWKSLCMPSCLRPQGRDVRPQGRDVRIRTMFLEQEPTNTSSAWPEEPGSLPDGQNDSEISHLVERLAEIVDHSKFPPGRKSSQVVERTLSLEEDGGWVSNQGGDDGIVINQSLITSDSLQKPLSKSFVILLPVLRKENELVFFIFLPDNKEKIIDAIVALLRKSGDELQEATQKNKTFWQRIRDMITSYAFFRRVIDQYFEETPIDSTGNSEDQVKSIKVALMMEATTRLTAMDSHPMSLMLGFGTKYLQENFSPWIQSQGGWGKALGLPDQEE